MSNLIFINGKFLRNGVEEKPEFGNQEQIDLIKKIQKAIDSDDEIEYSFRGGGEIDVKMEFDCILCENTVSYERTFDVDVDDDGDVEYHFAEKFDYKNFYCKKCYAKYKMEDGKIYLEK